MYVKVLIVRFFILPLRKVEIRITLSASPISPSDLFYVALFFFNFFLFHGNDRKLKYIETILR